MWITPGQLVSLCTALSVVTRDRQAHVFIASQLVGRKLNALSDLTLDDWRTLRDLAYPDWRAEDWTVDSGFIRRATSLYNEYQETVLGQLRLF